MIELEPIGVVRSPYIEKYDAPRQPGVDDRSHVAVIELMPGRNLDQAAADLKGFDRVWVIAYFDQVGGWKPKVLTPRDRVKRSVLATRSPHRPNPIALSSVKLLDVDGLRITVENIDLLDGTPVLDIKPYLPYADAFPDSSIGWLSGLQVPKYQVVFNDGIEDGIDERIILHVQRTLSADPFPHPYRRTSIIDDDQYELAYKQWRFRYTIDSNVIRVSSVNFLAT